MNYYPYHIGDFRSGTINMSRKSRWIYRDMLDAYYDTEGPLPLDFDLLCDMLGVESDEEIRLVEKLLRFKFEKTDEGYRNHRCDKEIEAYRQKAETAKANGKRGGRPRKANDNQNKPSGFQSAHDLESIGNQEETKSKTNQEPITNNHNKDICANGFARFWDAYPKKKSKGIAEKAFLKIKPSEQLLETMLESIERAKTSDDWKKDNGQFIPYPATWLNAKGWEDDAGPLPAGQDSIFAGAI